MILVMMMQLVSLLLLLDVPASLPHLVLFPLKSKEDGFNMVVIKAGIKNMAMEDLMFSGSIMKTALLARCSTWYHLSRTVMALSPRCLR